MAGKHEDSRKPSGKTKFGGERAKTGADTPAGRSGSWATSAPNAANRPSRSTTSSPRVTNLIPQVRPADEQPAVTRPRQSKGVLKTASAAPPAPNAPMKTKTQTGKSETTAGSSSPRTRKPLTPETITLPAVTDPDGDPNGSGSQTRPRQRRTSTARPVRPEDTALVARQTLIMNALEIVGEDARLVTGEMPALREPTDMVIVDADHAERSPVTVVPAGTLAPTPLWLQPRRQGDRTLLAGMLSCLMTLGIILGVLQAASPIGSAQGNLSPFALLAAQNSSNKASGQPAGPWDTQSGASLLGLGGGAGPGVHAPGSAGLPTGKNTGTTPPKTSTPPPSTSGISAPPLRPWPPSWAYDSVPGYYSFRMTEPASGYYWWAFGQCTWWAQYKRQDENLRHMGNAEYWAAGAAARGYRVGRTPVAGATVVFQPGVEGAGGAGHVAHVVKVYPDGWFLISEMNFYWNGGGWGRVDYRFAYVRSGVSFIY
ncbi:MAG TPA: CHAP domain-containing protein [Ktedonobacterales bacterium]|nr:CHAP domain-containing protein [Ktedonobacterales bacterium]